ncbi:hypothetical protein [Lactococcus cremoris]|uniref:hypothetical protein n=1 Tax=Lactococcus lactis subsp. cremoris TaxID=1359 RepID=UPI0021823EA7|nr:hypothetical protein [Lactococcus cremoris]MCT0502110.1 hypothetical protein [Lactococcus cremoris]
MSELETAQELAETAVRQVNVFALQGDKVDFLINQLKQIASLPQLTIPKSIADEFDQIYEDMEEYQTNVAQMFSSMQHYFDLESYPEILHWLEDDVKNTNVVLAYLAGKALGVDLVKVV